MFIWGILESIVLFLFSFHAHHSLGRAKSAITLCFLLSSSIRASLFLVVPLFSVTGVLQRSWSLLHLWIGVFVCFLLASDQFLVFAVSLSFSSSGSVLICTYGTPTRIPQRRGFALYAKIEDTGISNSRHVFNTQRNICLNHIIHLYCFHLSLHLWLLLRPRLGVTHTIIVLASQMISTILLRTAG